MKIPFFRLLSWVALYLLCTSSIYSQSPKNILLIIADDFNSWTREIGYYPQAITPNLDALSQRGVLFTHTYSPSAICNPSRNAMMSGFRPNTTEHYHNYQGYVRNRPAFANIKTLNQYFTENSYYTYAGGKVYHPQSMGGVESDSAHWSGLYTEGVGSPGGNLVNWEADNHNNLGWSVGEFDLNTAGDTRLANHMAQFVQNYSLADHEGKPFFAAVGFYRPHLPWNIHRQFWDMYSEDTLDIPQGYLSNDLDDHVGQDTTLHHEIVSKGKWKEAIHAYLAGISYADYNTGILLDALENSPHKDNTIIVFMGDHGWHLGEKSVWDKARHYQNAFHTSFIIYDPSAQGNGTKCMKPVSLQDLYPTLVEIAGLAPKTDIEGESLAPLLADPQDPNWSKPVIMTNWGNNALRTEEYRLFEHHREDQLYRIDVDPWEFHNLYFQPEYSTLIDSLNNQIAQINQVGFDLRSKLENNYQYSPSLNILPGIVEAENYDEGVQNHTYYDHNPGNAGGQLRGDGVDIYSDTNSSGGYYVGGLEEGEWLEYSLYQVPSSIYQINFRISNSNPNPDQAIALYLGTKFLGEVAIGTTNAANSWEYITLPNVYIHTQSSRILTVQIKGGNFQLDHIHFEWSNTSACTDEPEVEIQPLGSVPADAGIQPLSGLPEGGFWTGAVSSTGLFDPSSGEGLYEVVYHVNFGEGCIKSDTMSIEVTPPLDPCFQSEEVLITPAGPFFADAGIQQLNASPSGGTWSGPINPDGQFDPSVGTGMYTLIYTVEVGNACLKADTSLIEVLEPLVVGECSSPINLALGKQTQQSSTRGNGVSSIAVDGDTEGTGNNWVANPKITHTQTEPQPWWEVDLGQVSSIEEIHIYNRTGCCQTRLKDFYVLVSDQPFSPSASLTDLLNTAGVNSSFYSGAAGNQVSIPFASNGRYVRIQLTSTNQPLHIAEVQVMGCPHNGSDPCEGTEELSITPAGPFTTDQGVQSLTANPLGGVWSGSVDSNGNFDPSQGAGTYTIIYTYDFGGECSKSDTTTLLVMEPGDPCVGVEEVLITPAGPFTTVQGIQTLQASPLGGAWSGSATLEGTFDPIQGAGTYSVIYTYDFEGGCSKSDTTTLLVMEPGDPCEGVEELLITPARPFTTDQGIQTLQASPSGGIWSGSATLAGTFDPSQGTGTYEVTYTVDFGNSCVKSASETIEVNDPPTGGECSSPINLALNRATQQSSTRGNGISSIAVDGDTEGTGNNWVANPKIIHTQTEPQPWWEVDLGQVSSIEELHIYNRTGCCQSRLKDFYVLVSDQPFGTSASLQELLNTPTISTTFFSGAAGNQESIPFIASGRYVRIQLTSSNNPLHIAEVQVMGCPGSGSSDPCFGSGLVNITPVGPFTTDQGIQTLEGSPIGGTWSGSVDVGGNFDPSQGAGTYPVFYSYNFSEGCSKTDTSFIIVSDPSDPCLETEEVNISSLDPFTTDQGIQTLEGSPIGGTWAGSVDAGGNFDPSQGAGTYTVFYTYDFGNDCAKSDTAIVEVEESTLGEECTNPSNLALGKETAQSSVRGNGISSIAVDGDTEGSGNNWVANPKITHTQTEPHPWWEVNLGQQADIQQIHIYNRTSCCMNRLTDFYVFISNESFDPNVSLADLLSSPHIHSHYYPGAAAESVSLAISDSGQFVRIQLTSTNQPLHLAEVQVMGCFIGPSQSRFAPVSQAINGEPKEAELRIFPNPTPRGNEVYVNLWDAPESTGNLEVLTLRGKRVYLAEQIDFSEKISIQISTLPSSIYLLRAYGKGWEVSRRWVVK